MTLQVTYELEKNDILAFQRYAAKKSPMGKKMRRVFLLLMLPYSLYSALGLESWLGAAIWFVLDYAFWVLIFLSVTWALNEYAFRRSVPGGESNGITGRHQLILDDQKVVERTNVNEARHQWKGMDRVEQDEQYIYIFITPQAAHVIPKRTFADRQEAEQFFTTAQTFLARAKNPEAETSRFDRQTIKKATVAADLKADKMPVAYFDERARSPIERVFSE